MKAEQNRRQAYITTVRPHVKGSDSVSRSPAHASPRGLNCSGGLRGNSHTVRADLSCRDQMERQPIRRRRIPGSVATARTRL